MTRTIDIASLPTRRRRLTAALAATAAAVAVGVATAPAAHADTINLPAGTTVYVNTTAHPVTVCINGACVVVLPNGVHGWD